jgi:hypothetical protein
VKRWVVAVVEGAEEGGIGGRREREEGGGRTRVGMWEEG